MPLFTRLAVNYAKTSTVVTPSLRQFILRRAPKLNPQIVYNGISDDALLSAKKLALDKRHRITLAYVGAVYGGDRPYVQAMEWLALAASELSKPWTGLSLTFVGREDVSDLPLRYVCDAFQINAGGEVGKQEALNISADSNINIVLVGKSEEHRCGIPLKIYDLLGVGRPILYIGPADSDAVRFLEEFAAGDFFMIDTEADHPASIETLAEWLCDAASKETSAKCEPSSSSQVRKILQLIGMESY
ncbi:hypothetical protein ASD55_03885 [Rhodanobacter sp. Root561]|nr:hypothetical protein ASD55_03885 [Rhodanobacter sp. Root561]